MCVHHDIPTVRDYFDSVTILNVRKIASGSVDEVFTLDNLKAAYGGAKTFADENNETLIF
mgnify:FL=1